MSLKGRIDSLNEQAKALFKARKRDTIVFIIPWENEKGWIIDVCHDRHGKENTELKKQLEECTTFEELRHELDGYTTNVPNIRRSDEYEV